MLKRERKALELALSQLKQGESFLLQERVMVCKKETFASTTLHFTNPQGAICYEINKEYGSQLVLLYRGIRTLEDFLAADLERTKVKKSTR